MRREQAMETKPKASAIRIKRKVFGWIFFISILVFAVSIISVPQFQMSRRQAPVTTEDKSAQTDPQPTAQVSGPNTTIIVSVISLLTSITSLLGFFSTTLLAWRKEKRETITAELEIRKKELELEKLRAELAKPK